MGRKAPPGYTRRPRLAAESDRVHATVRPGAPELLGWHLRRALVGAISTSSAICSGPLSLLEMTSERRTSSPAQSSVVTGRVSLISVSCQSGSPRPRSWARGRCRPSTRRGNSHSRPRVTNCLLFVGMWIGPVAAQDPLDLSITELLQLPLGGTRVFQVITRVERVERVALAQSERAITTVLV
jgi:hypothetical protein